MFYFLQCLKIVHVFFVIIQGVHKLVIEKSAVISSELEVTSWSGKFKKLRLVL
jgi:hypothetical protein